MSFSADRKAELIETFIKQLAPLGFQELLAEEMSKNFLTTLAGSYFFSELATSQLPNYLKDLFDDDDKQLGIVAKNLESFKAKIYPNSIPSPSAKPTTAPTETAKRSTTQDDDQQQGQSKKKVKGGPITNTTTTNQQNPAPPSTQQPSVLLQEQAHKNLKQQLEKEGKQKCKYFPFCKNTQTCPYYHPTEKCKYFPHCKFGEKCLYQHESCKFKEKCTKYNCQFAHPFKKNGSFIQSLFRGLMQTNNPLKSKKKYTPGGHNNSKGGQNDGDHQQQHQQQE